MTELPYLILFNDVSYYLRNGYYVASYEVARRRGVEALLHRAIWVYYNGPIPEGCIVHHEDNRTYHNSISNLELKTQSEHSIHHLKQRYYRTHGVFLGEQESSGFLGEAEVTDLKNSIGA